jgi:2-polyprenyl-6-methoxyphenol hydroxylase-like FAD-dependent oxidoreductase
VNDVPATADGADVVVVGYGPVGQVLATLLGRLGHRVIVCENHPELYATPRAGHFDHEIMRIFQSMGVAGEVARVAVPARRYELLRADGQVLARLPRDWAAPSGWDASYHFYQPELEAVLDRAARAQDSVEIRRGCEVIDVCDDGERVTVRTVDRAGGGARRISARYVVGADGANSIVRRLGGFDFEDLGFQADWLVVDVRFKDGQPIPDIPDTAQICDPARPSHMALMGGRYVRWEFMVVAGDDHAHMSAPETVWRLLRRWTGPEDAELVRHTVYTFRSAIADPFRRGRLMLAGDAAHLMPPFLGQGMCSGLRDASTLAWMLNLVLRGTASPALLEAYTSSRGPHVRSYIEESVRVGRIVCETDPERAAARDARLTAGDAQPPPFQPSAGALVHTGDALAGILALQPCVPAGAGTVLLDDLLGSGFQLLTVEGAAESWLRAEDRAFLGRIGARQARVRCDERFEAWLAEAGAVAVLVRPDHYVYGSVKSLDQLGGLVAALRRDLHATT